MVKIQITSIMKSEEPDHKDVEANSTKSLLSSTSLNKELKIKSISFSQSRMLVATGLCISSVCLFVTVTFCGFLVLSGHETMTTDQDNHEVCLPCAQVRPNPAARPEAASASLMKMLKVCRSQARNAEGGDVHGDDDVEVCCARTAAQYAALFQLILKRQEEARKLADVLGSGTDEKPQSNVTVSAHLVLKPPVNTAGTADTSVPGILQWKSSSESPSSHMRSSLKLQNNTIYVLTPGLYFVYCQVLLSVTQPEKRLSSSRAVSAYVERHSLAYPSSSGILMKTRHTHDEKKPDRHSSYVGQLVFLHRGDQLFVRISDPSLLSYDDTASFFGLFKVGN